MLKTGDTLLYYNFTKQMKFQMDYEATKNILYQMENMHYL